MLTALANLEQARSLIGKYKKCVCYRTEDEGLPEEESASKKRKIPSTEKTAGPPLLTTDIPATGPVDFLRQQSHRLADCKTCLPAPILVHAVIPVDHEMALKKRWGKLPFNSIVTALDAVTTTNRGFVVRTDEPLSEAATGCKVRETPLDYEFDV